MWKVITNSNLNPPLKLFFYLPILTNTNLLLKIYCENIVVTFLNQDFLFIILFLLSQPSFYPFVFFFFPFFFSSTHVVLISIPLLLFSVFLIHESCRHSSSSHSLFFFSGTLSLSLSLFLLDSKTGYFHKSAVRALFSLAFSSRFGRMNFVDSGEKIFSRVFLPPYFPYFAK